jgi:hypothetical protein
MDDEPLILAFCCLAYAAAIWPARCAFSIDNVVCSATLHRKAQVNYILPALNGCAE